MAQPLSCLTSRSAAGADGLAQVDVAGDLHDVATLRRISCRMHRNLKPAFPTGKSSSKWGALAQPLGLWGAAMAEAALLAEAALGRGRGRRRRAARAAAPRGSSCSAMTQLQLLRLGHHAFFMSK